MPSLFTHLIIAQDALEALPTGPARSMLEANSREYYLGCLAPDLPYFDIFHDYRGLRLGSVLSPVSHSLEARVLAWLGWSLPEQGGWALRLHSVSSPKVLGAWARWARGRKGPLAAFTAGMLLHCAADEVLHPKVHEDSGDGASAESLRLHRELEINLDLALLRSRGVVLEGLNLCSLLESFIGRVDARGEHLSPTLKHDWVQASGACDGAAALRRGELDAWSRGFAGAMRLLEHPFSPVQQQKLRFLAGGEEHWRTFFARELYLGSHVPRAVRTCASILERSFAAAGPKPAAGVAVGLEEGTWSAALS